MSCILRATGREFDVDRYLKTTAFRPLRVFHKGEARSPLRPRGPKNEASGLNIHVSTHAMSRFQRQVDDCLRFLRRHYAAIAKLRRFPGVEGCSLDFGVVRSRRYPVEAYTFPEALVVLAARLKLEFELSDYTDIARGEWGPDGRRRR